MYIYTAIILTTFWDESSYEEVIINVKMQLF